MERNCAVIFDACVLFPAPLRDLLVELAGRAFHQKIFRAKWTNEIHEEWISNLLEERKDLTRQALERTRQLMDKNVPECLVSSYEHRIANLELQDKDDRHVLAAAIESSAKIIITANLRDFPDDKLQGTSVIAKHPDDFICELLDDYEDTGERLLIDSITAIKNRLKNPEVTWDEYFSTLENNKLTKAVEKLKTLIPISKATSK